MPEFQKDVLSPHMINEISELYLKHCSPLQRLRNLSDECNAGMHGALLLPDVDTENHAAALLLLHLGI